jgi:hypothetical protein
MDPAACLNVVAETKPQVVRGVANGSPGPLSFLALINADLPGNGWSDDGCDLYLGGAVSNLVQNTDCPYSGCSWLPSLQPGKLFLPHPSQFTTINSFCSATLACWGHVVVQLVEAPGWKPEVRGFDSGRTMALVSTEPLTEGSTRNISWGLKVPVTPLPPSCADCLEIWEPPPSGTRRVCPGLYRHC